MHNKEVKRFKKRCRKLLKGELENTLLTWEKTIQKAEAEPSLECSQALLTELDSLIKKLKAKGRDGNGNALFLLGYMYQNGYGSMRSRTRAWRCYNKAIRLGNVAAMRHCAQMHEDAKNYPEAIRCYDAAIRHGDAQAMHSRAVMHMRGRGGRKNISEAIRLHEEAIRQNNVDSMCDRARLHMMGKGGPKNYPEAVRLLEQAITLGNRTAMNNRAFLYERGEGGAQSFPEAIRLYDMAIALGDTNAMINRAQMHAEGLGGPQNFPEAIRLFDMAIALGNPTAMNHRAQMHEDGRGGPKNLPAATYLYECSARRGDKTAKGKLIAFYKLDAQGVVELLNLIWPDLVDGKSFSAHTLSMMKKYAKDLILEKIQKSNLGSSLYFLRTLRQNNNHPLTKILNEGRANSVSRHFGILLNDAHKMGVAREAIIGHLFAQKTGIFSSELVDYVLSPLQPGHGIDKKAGNVARNICKAIEKALEQATTLKPWALSPGGREGIIRYRGQDYLVPEDICKIHQFASRDDNYHWLGSISACIEKNTKSSSGLLGLFQKQPCNSATRYFYKKIEAILHAEPDVPFSNHLSQQTSAISR